MFVVLLGCSEAAGSTQREIRDVTGEALIETAVPDGDSEVQSEVHSDVDPKPDVAVDGQDDATTLEDADVPGAVTGSACDDDDECRSGWCVASAIGRVCVDLCITMCEPGEACIPVDSGTDPVSVCVPTVAPNPEVVDGEVIDTNDTADGSETSVGEIVDATDDGSEPPDGVIADGVTDGVITDDTTLGDATPTETDISIITDQDGDGIPDDEDLLPCLAITLVVFNEDVTSASLVLNGVVVVNANAFPTDDAIYVTINPAPGENTLALGGQLTGSPTDTLTLFISDSTGRLYFATVITREPGKPADRTYTFTIDVTCP